MIAETLALMLMSMGGVGLWTLRVTFAAEDRRAVASGTAALEAVVFAVSFSQLLSGLDELHRLVGYAVGVAIGTYAGMCGARHLPRSQRRAEPDGSSPRHASGLPQTAATTPPTIPVTITTPHPTRTPR